jgi:hypothetical protein
MYEPHKYCLDCKKTSIAEGVNMLVLHGMINSGIQFVQVQAAVIASMVAITDSDLIIRDGYDHRQRLL